MWTDEVELLHDVSAAAWISPRLTDELCTITDIIPSGFAAYARVLHPVGHAADALVRWSEVAEHTGRTVHPTVQWHLLVGSNDAYNFHGGLWDDSPDRGSLAPAALGALCAILPAHTAQPEHCYFCLWEGWGQLCTGVAVVVLTKDGDGRPVQTGRHPPLLSVEEQQAQRVRLPWRDYFLFRGPLSAIGALSAPDTRGGRDWQTPQLFWPADQAWCVASEIDFDSTLVGGSRELIDAILASPELEAWSIQPEDSLTCDGDTVNPVPKG